MTSGPGWDLTYRRDDLSTSDIRVTRPAALRPGEVRLAVEMVGVSTLTATYARFADSPMRFGDVFAAPDGFVNVPVWGFARVTESRAPHVPLGGRYFGYLPMSTHHTISPQPVPGGLFDTTAHRDFLHPWYRTFEAAPEQEHDDLRALLHPLFPASYNLAESLAGHGASTVVISSASSKTAIGLAHLLARRGGQATVGLTAAEHRSFVEGLGLYDTVVAYDDLAEVTVDGPVVFVDLTNSVERMEAVYRHFGDRIVATTLVGFTHPRPSFEPPRLGPPAPQLFFTPAVEQTLMAEQGEETYKRRYAEAETQFITESSAWLTVTRVRGPEALAASVGAVLAGKQPPDLAEVLLP